MASQTTTLSQAHIASPPAWRSLLGRFGNWPISAKIGGALLALVLLGVVFAPLITSADPMALGAKPLVPPGQGGLLGSDDLGRDMLARVLYGGRISLLVGIVSAFIAVVLGLSIGIVAGFFGGAVDESLMRFTEMFQILPRLLVAIVVVTLLGGDVMNVIFVIGILSWPPTARIIRTQVLVIRHEEFIAAAILSGATYWRLISRHVLPNVLPFLLVSASIQVASAILSEAALSFLGLGDPSLPSWGQMLQQSQGYLRQAWWMSAFPGLALAITILGLNLLGDGLSSKLPGAAK
jgi:peptide/nickel transport system permease protein